MKPLTPDQRQTLIDAIAEAMRPQNDSYERFYDAILYGRTGLNDFTDEELLSEGSEWAEEPGERYDEEDPEVVLQVLLEKYIGEEKTE